jgi:ribosomal protein S18 acetylase RimI-like enzyme
MLPGIEIDIRKAKPSDAATITEFNLRLATETEGLHLDADLVRRGVAALLHDPAKGLYFVAEVAGAVVGQVMITYEWSDWRNGNLWWLQSVYVKPEFRQSGVFRALFRHVESQARAQGDVPGLRLYMHDDNIRARRSYEKLGMKRTRYEVFEMDLRREREGSIG